MLALPGYRLERTLRQTPHATLYHGVRTTDGQPVWVKEVCGSACLPAQTQVEREAEFLEATDGQGTLTLLEVAPTPLGWALITTPAEGERLDRFLAEDPLPVTHFLRLATALCNMLVALHTRRIVIRELRPELIVVAPDDERAVLTELDAAAGVWALGEHVAARPQLARYLSPELIEPHGHTIDLRSDLYALGVIFFEALTGGQHPFTTQRPLDLLRAHLVLPPASLHEHRPGLPPTLFAIVEKLLHKQPSARYQSAQGLLADLQRLDRCLGEGDNATFQPGSQDTRNPAAFPHAALGRDHELAEFESALELVAEGKMITLRIAGAGGMGKSTLLSECYRQGLRQQGRGRNRTLLMRCQADDRVTPGQSLRRLLQDASDLAALESAEEQQAFGHGLNAALGPLGGLLLELQPDLAHLLPTTPPPPPSTSAAPQSRRRLLHVLTTFFRELLPRDGVHVLFIDDLDRADATSLEWLTHVLTELRRGEHPRSLLIAVTHGEPASLSPECQQLFAQLSAAGAEVLTLPLSGLSREAVRPPLSTIVGTKDPARLEACVELLLRNTSGVPAALHQQVSRLLNAGIHDVGGLGLEPEAEADEPRMLATREFLGLPEESRHVLSTAAVLGMEFTPDQLAPMIGQSLAATASLTLPLLEQGLLLRRSRSLQFTSDSLYFAAKQSLRQEVKQLLHLQAARQLDSLPDRSLFRKCAHYLAAGALPTPSERLQLLELLRDAGEAALHRGAWAEALRYFERGLIKAEPLDEAPDVATELQLGKARALGLLQRDNEAAELFAALAAKEHLSISELSRIYTSYMRYHLRRLRFESATAVAHAGLLRLGLDPALADHSEDDLLSSLLELDLTAIARAPLATDEAFLGRAALHQELAVGVCGCVPQRCDSMAVSMLKSCLENGRTNDLAYRLLDLAMRLCLRGAYDEATRFTEVAQNLLPELEAPMLRPRAQYLKAALIAPYFGPFEAQMPFIQHAIRTALVAGDAESARLMQLGEFDFRFAQGEYLHCLRQSAEQHLEDYHSPIGVLASVPLLWRLRMTALLQGDSPHALSSDAALWAHLDLERVDQLDDRLAASTTALLAWVLLLLRRDPLAHQVATYSLSAQPRLALLPLRVMALAALAISCARLRRADASLDKADASLDKADASLDKQDFASARAQLSALTARCPKDYDNLLLVVDAEGSWSDQNLDRAHILLRRAQQQTNPDCLYLVAFIDETLSELSRAQGLSGDAARHVRLAIETYEQWGARALSAQLHETHDQLLQTHDHPRHLLASAVSITQPDPADADDSSIYSLDVETIVRLSRTILEETDLSQVLERFLSVAIESAKARRGTLLLSRAGILVVEALGHADGSFERISMPFDSYRDAPRTVVRAAADSLQTVEVHEADGGSELRADPWFSGRKVSSVMCCPILRQNRLIGLVVLENFTEARFNTYDRELVQYLTAQAAVALDNARLYAELSRANAELEDRVEQRTRELQLAKDLAEQARRDAVLATRAKSEFLAAMSHEIRTPMNGVLGMAQLLQETSLGEEQQEYLRTIRESGEALLSIINDILDLSKIEAGRLDLEAVRFSLRDSLESVGDILAPKAQEKDLELTMLIEPNVPDWCVGDPGRLRQVIINLANNAIKFTERGEVCVHVQIESGASDEFRLKVDVQDTGIGIPTDRIERLFEAFTQADASTTRRFGGTGLGLTISRRLAETMGGALTAVSDEGIGSTFTFTAMLARSVGESLPPLRGAAELRCLVYEPNDHGFLALSYQLQPLGAKAERVPDLNEAMERLHPTERPLDRTIILARFPLPADQEGALRSIVETVPVRVALLTTVSSRPAAEALRLAGKRAVLTRPLRRMPLRRCLLDALGVSLQTQKAPLAVSITPQNSHVDRSRFRIMVVEDNRVNQILATRMLKKLGYECQLAGDGRKGLEQAVQHGPWHLILMDCQMPEMDGFEAARRIRKHEQHHGGHVPIVALTANAMKGDREACLAAGMDDYLSKPIDMNALASMLDRYLMEVDPEAAAELGLVHRATPTQNS